MNRKTYIVTATNSHGRRSDPKEVKLYPIDFGDYYENVIGYPKFLESRGWTDIDLVQKPRAKRGTASSVAKYKFQVDTNKLNEAIDLLGIKMPVNIRFHNRKGSTNGNHYFDGREHSIMLKGYRTAQEASNTLWHELTHCQQSERLGHLEFNKAYDKEGRSGNAYRNNKFEIEAREMAENMSDVLLTYAI